MLGILDDTQVEEVLRACSIGRIGCRDGEEVYIVPISYAYAEGAVYGHSAEGRKLTVMRRAPEVCFEVEDVHGLDDWRSVIARGWFEELHGGDAGGALDLLRARFAQYEIAPVAGPSSPMHGHGTSAPPALFRINLLSWSGRFERPAAAARSTADRPVS